MVQVVQRQRQEVTGWIEMGQREALEWGKPLSRFGLERHQAKGPNKLRQTVDNLYLLLSGLGVRIRPRSK
jgi:hypothetical protein